MKTIFLFFALLGCSCTLFWQCGTASTSSKPCVYSNTETMIRWGLQDSLKNLSGYELDAQGRVWKYSKLANSSTYQRDSVAQTSVDFMCFALDTTKKAFIKVQTLYYPGALSHYVEYVNPIGHVNLRAIWNKRYNTYGSQDFRFIFDTLQTHIVSRIP